MSERSIAEYGQISLVIKTLFFVLEYVKKHPGCHRIDIAKGLSMSCDDVYEAVVALSADGLAYQNQETLEHYSIVDGWAG